MHGKLHQDPGRMLSPRQSANAEIGINKNKPVNSGKEGYKPDCAVNFVFGLCELVLRGLFVKILINGDEVAPIFEKIGLV